MSKFGGKICIKFERAVGKSFSAKADDVNPKRCDLSSPLIHSHLHKINIVHLSDASLFFALTTPAKRGKILEIVKLNISWVRGIRSNASPGVGE